MSSWTHRNDSNSSHTGSPAMPSRQSSSGRYLSPGQVHSVQTPQAPAPRPEEAYNIPVYGPVTEVRYNHGTAPLMGGPAGPGIVKINDVVFTNPFHNGNSSINQQQVHYHPHPHHSSTPVLPAVQVPSEGTSVPVLYAYFGREPVFVTCPYCRHIDETRIESVIGIASILHCFALPIIGLFLGRARDIRHYCRNCLNVIATYHP